jgi:hypothetical protein
MKPAFSCRYYAYLLLNKDTEFLFVSNHVRVETIMPENILKKRYCLADFLKFNNMEEGTLRVDNENILLAEQKVTPTNTKISLHIILV